MPSHNSLPQERLDAIETMLLDGAALAEVARTLKVGRVTINKYFPQHRGWSKQHNAEVSRAKRKFNSVMKSNGASHVLE